MHVSGMVAASYFARRCLADPTHIVVPNTFRGATREFRPRARPHIPHSARSAPAEFTTLHMMMPTPHAHSLRTISYLHASRLPLTRLHIRLSARARVPAQFRTAFARCTPRIFFSPLHSNGHVPCPLRSALRASARHVRRTGQVTSASRTEHAIAEWLWRAR